tara:strand:- start:71 stop:319 length:249 start_codon:yes stop_codon:yes gene_type:complete
LLENVLFKSVKYSFQLIQSSFTLGNTLNKRNELQNLQDNINELEPKERIELLIKLLPYVMPKVQTVSRRDGEPIGLDWINEF